MPAKYYTGQNVMDAARERVAWLFDEFENITVNFSGGKDSTVVLHLALAEAKKRGRLPLRVFFIDQEAEWEATADYIRSVMTRPDVEPHWLQLPFKMFNATSTTDQWLKCWDPEAKDKWMRPQEPFAITENIFGTDRFYDMFDAWQKHTYGDAMGCSIGGVRCEESPARAMGLTHWPAYKWATWGRVTTKGKHFVMYPIFDWSADDVWTAIAREGWPYNRIYDLQYQYGIPVRNMRVSNLHHETAVQSLWSLQEIEPQTYAKLVARIGGIDMAGKMGAADYFVKELPYMFRDWVEYRDYLLERLVDDEKRPIMAKQFARQDKIYAEAIGWKMHRMHVRCILTGDFENTHMNVIERTPDYVRAKRAWDEIHGKREQRA